MSYDIDMVIDTGGENPATVFEVGNMTSNVSPMWTKALGFPLKDLHFKSAGESIPLLEKAVLHMRENPDEYSPLNPDNGWGNYDSALRYLTKLLRACKDHPLTRIYISW